MSKHQEWKMVHLLYRYGYRAGNDDPPALTMAELTHAGVHCDSDTWVPLERAGVIERDGDRYSLAAPVVEVVRRFTLAKTPRDDVDLRVDYPEAFVAMPFNELWSDDVYAKMLKPGIEDANLDVVRGDDIVRIGDLAMNVWQSITQAGVIVADVSEPNPNVYYEVGLAHALGKPVFIFKDQNAKLPADFGGDHYYPYDRRDLAAGRNTLAKALEDWAKEEDNQAFGVKDLVDRSRK